MSEEYARRAADAEARALTATTEVDRDAQIAMARAWRGLEAYMRAAGAEAEEETRGAEGA